MDRPSPQVVHVGAASRDLTDEDPRGWRLGGGVAYGSLTTARLGLRTAAIVGLDTVALRDAWELDDLRAAGVEILPVPIPDGPVFVNTETPAGRIQTSPAVGGPMEPGVAPAAWRIPGIAWSFVPVAGELPSGWADVPDRGAPVVVGWQGLLRTLTPGARVERLAPSASQLVARAALVGVSEHDLAPGTDVRGLVSYLRPGAELALTRGSGGGEVLGTDGTTRAYAPVRSGGETDATGAGDVFLATLFATRLVPDLMDGIDELLVAAAAASLAVEGLGLAGVPDLGAVRARAAGQLATGRPGD